MNLTKEPDKEQRIYSAAHSVFLKKGLSETTMQDIADEAGISRTALHYYFRNKDKLFETFFTDAINNIIPKINETINKDLPLTEKIVEIANNYLDLLHHNQLLPGFVASEIQRDPTAIIAFIKQKSEVINFSSVRQQIDREVAEGKIRPFQISQLVLCVAGLCIFPFICRPLLDTFLLTEKPETFEEFINDRKQVVSDMITQWLKNNK